MFVHTYISGDGNCRFFTQIGPERGQFIAMMTHALFTLFGAL